MSKHADLIVLMKERALVLMRENSNRLNVERITERTAELSEALRLMICCSILSDELMDETIEKMMAAMETQGGPVSNRGRPPEFITKEQSCTPK